MSHKTLDSDSMDGGQAGQETAGSGLAHRIRLAGLVLGPLAFVMILGLLPAGGEGQMGVAARAVLGLGAWMALWWLTEAAPLPATALLPIVVLPLCRVCPVEQATAAYADPLIFVFLGGFVIGKALESSGLHRRLALVMMLIMGTTPRRMIGAVMLATAAISMFVSNTATAMMMLPLGMSIVALVDAHAEDLTASGRGGWDRKSVDHFACALLLGICYAANIGGIGTPIGTPPNLVMTGFLANLPESERIVVGFWPWMILAMPVMLVLLPAAWAVLVITLPVKAHGIAGGRTFVRGELRRLGPMSGREGAVLAIFLATVALWMFRQPLVDWLDLRGVFLGKRRDLLTDAGIALAGALALLLIPMLHAKGRARPVITWAQAEQLPWGVLLMFGGGLSLAAAISASGLDKTLADGLGFLTILPAWLIVPVLCIVIVAVGELASNVALAALLMPILYPAAKSMGLPATELLMITTIACSMGFALPVATPPNAIVFASGRIGLPRMMRCGVVMDIVGVAVIASVFGVAGKWLMAWAGFS